MEPLEKLEMILRGMIQKNKQEIERAKNSGLHPAYPYPNGLEHEVVGLQKALARLHEIKQNAPSMDDDIVIKMYSSEK